MGKDDKKQPYEKPVLRMIELHAEEIMGFCKITAVSPGPARPACSVCRLGQYGGS